MNIEAGIVAMAFAANAMLLAGLGYYVVRAKRWLWNEIEGVKVREDDLRCHLVAARKEIVLTSVGASLRLPALMPSQNGEDVLVHRFFGGRRDGFFVEIGAYDGVGFSNTYFLEALGWHGVLIEPVPEHAEACRRQRPYSRVVQAACGLGGGTIGFKVVRGENGVGTLSYMGNQPDHEQRIRREGGTIDEVRVPLLPLEAILGSPTPRIGLLSIDVEGAELGVLRSADISSLKPDLIVIEDQTLGADRRVEELLISAGYRKDFVWTHNVFYVGALDSRRVGW